MGTGRGTFKEVSKEAGPYFHEAHVGRGVALGDYDNDGAVDVAVNNCGEPAALLHNETTTPHHWIRLELEGSRHVNAKGANRDGVGARVTVKAGGRTFVRRVVDTNYDFPFDERTGRPGLTGENFRVDSYPMLSYDPIRRLLALTWADDRHGSYAADGTWLDWKTRGEDGSLVTYERA